MQKWISWCFWRIKTSSVLVVFTILSIWIVSFSFLSIIKHIYRRDTSSCVHDILTRDYLFRSHVMTDSGKLNFRTSDKRVTSSKPVLSKTATKTTMKEIITFRDKFFDWQDSRSDLELKIGPDYIINSSRYFIYRCDTQTMSFCGGWGDRIKGIFTAYIIANLTGRVFKIEMGNPPCDTAEMIIPNLVNWSLPIPFHKTVIPNGAGVIRANMVGNLTFIRKLEYTNFTEWLGTAQFVYFKGNAAGIKEFRNSIIYKTRLSWMHNIRISHILAAIFKRLFKLSSQLNNKMKLFLAKMAPTSRHKLVCAHVRVGKNPTNPLDSIVITRAEEIPRIWEFLNNQSRTDLHPVFIMSDSDAVIEEAKRQDFGQRLFVTPGAVVHVDRFSSGKSHELCNGFEKVLFDQHVLMACDILLVGRSGLSKIAASVRGENKGLFMLTPGGIVAPWHL